MWCRTGRRSLTPAFVGLIITAAMGGCSRQPSGPSAERPDIVLVTIDTLRADRLGCYGDREAATPVLDALAAHGVRFADAVAPVPLTLPSHASLLTASSPLVHGVRDNLGFRLPSSIVTAAEQFRTAAYETAAFVSGYPLHRQFGLARGFDQYDDHFTRGGSVRRPQKVERRADETVAAVESWLRGSARSERPLFLWVHLFDPHAPYEPPEPYLARFRERLYDGEVAFTDSQIGALLEQLNGVRGKRPRFVAVTADHGEGLDDHGEPTHGLFVYDSTVRVPLIVSGPGLPAGRTVTSLARLIDVVPTLLDLAGVPALAGVEGASLRSAIEGSGAPRPAYVESLFGRLCCGWAPLHAWRDGTWMYIDAPKPELYDVSSDEREEHNLAATRPVVASRLAAALSTALARDAPRSQARVDAAARDRLRSLGYISGGRASTPSLRDPKDMVGVSVRLGAAIELEDRDPARAARELEAVVRDDPTNPQARRQLATTLGALRRFDESVRLLSSLVADGDSSPETLDAFGEALTEVGRGAQAKEVFERALRSAPDDGAALRSLAGLAIERGDLADARVRLEALHAHEPADADAALKLGIVLVQLGEKDRAIEVFTHLVEQAPNNTDALLDLGGALLDRGRAVEATAYFQRAIAAGADTPLAWNGLAAATIKVGDTAAATNALKHSLRLRPDQPEAAATLRRLTR